MVETRFKVMKKKIGIVGTGFIAKGLAFNLLNQENLEVTKILTRRELSSVQDIPDSKLLTNSLDDLVDNVDIIVECSGDTIHATEVALKAVDSNLPLVTMNSEFQVTTGSYFVDKGFITEAEGDQPGCIAALAEEARYMGFKPLVYGNIKSFLDNNPSKESMEYWGNKKGISLQMVTSFTDGTKVQTEQVLVANGLNAKITKQGFIGPVCNTAEEGAHILAQGVNPTEPISDYVLCSNGPGGVFITAEHEDHQKAALSHLKMGEGPYVLVRNYHLCHLEITRTLMQVAFQNKILINNSANPQYSVAAISKKAIKSGQKIPFGIGSFELRGEAIEIATIPNHIPIGLLKDAVCKKEIKEGEIVTFDHFDLPDSRALNIWSEIKEKAVKLNNIQ